jgi:hypothetical protein
VLRTLLVSWQRTTQIRYDILMSLSDKKMGSTYNMEKVTCQGHNDKFERCDSMTFNQNQTNHNLFMPKNEKLLWEKGPKTYNLR